MCNCNSEWAQRARNYLQQNRNNQDEKYLVLNFLLTNNKCGRNNGVFLDELINYLKSKGYLFNRENFQYQVLIPLKYQNFLISLPYPGGIGGVFIPCNIDEVKKYYNQVLNRVYSELTNIQNLANFSNVANNLSDIVDLVQEEIKNL